jgi:hypothetical protein
MLAELINTARSDQHFFTSLPWRTIHECSRVLTLARTSLQPHEFASRLSQTILEEAPYNNITGPCSYLHSSASRRTLQEVHIAKNFRNYTRRQNDLLMRHQKSVQVPAGCENKQLQNPENRFSHPRGKTSDVHTKTSSCVEVPFSPFKIGLCVLIPCGHHVTSGSIQDHACVRSQKKRIL